jgi:hypothetical protein
MRGGVTCERRTERTRLVRIDGAAHRRPCGPTTAGERRRTIATSGGWGSRGPPEDDTRAAAEVRHSSARHCGGSLTTSFLFFLYTSPQLLPGVWCVRDCALLLCLRACRTRLCVAPLFVAAHSSQNQSTAKWITPSRSATAPMRPAADASSAARRATFPESAPMPAVAAAAVPARATTAATRAT